MPYISSETVKEKRAALRRSFPSKDGWKLSVRKNGHSGISVDFLRGPVVLTDCERGYQQINHYFITRHACSDRAAAVLEKAASIAGAGNKTEYVCSDYGSIPSFYVNLSVGRWDSPYEVVS